jgi:hypothetical protein
LKEEGRRREKVKIRKLNKINRNSDHIKISGHVGGWYVIDSCFHSYYPGRELFLLEHETFGDEAPCLIVTEEGEIVAEDVVDGMKSELDMLERREEDE